MECLIAFERPPVLIGALVHIENANELFLC
jgi:hypothetical protein